MVKTLVRAQMKSELFLDISRLENFSLENIKEHLTNVLLASSLALRIVDSNLRYKKVTPKKMEGNPFLNLIRRKDISSDEVRSQLAKVALANSLALNILSAHEKPLNQLMDELIEIEYEGSQNLYPDRYNHTLS